MGKNYTHIANPTSSGSARNSHQLRNHGPNLRRVWVKRNGGNPTTIMMGPTDIIDDLKSVVLNKFPNSLGRICDPADIQIQVRGHTLDRPQQVRRLKHNKPTQGRLILESEENRVNLPVNSSLLPPESQLSSLILEPDQVVWEILDDYFPGGMAMSDAFIILVEIKGNSQNFATESQGQSVREEYIDTRSGPQASPQAWLGSSRVSPVSSIHQQYHNLKPQQPIPIKHDSFGKNRSVSPNLLGARSPPIPLHAPHKRSHSIPPQSPITSFNQQSKNGNSQAVLLLPKNFSLGEQHTLKKYAMDDVGASKTFAHLTEPQLSVNVTNIGNDENSSGLNFEISMDNKSEAISDIQPPVPTKGLENSAPNHSSLSSGASTPRKEVQKDDTQESIKIKSNKKPKETMINMSTFEKVLPLISVLVVEDNSINQAILGAFLRRHKIHYEIAKNGQEAVDKWRKGGFHLVLMDIQLPVKSGIEATKEIRHLEKVNRIGVFAQHELANSNYNTLQLKEVEKLDLNTFRSPVIIVALTASSNSSVDKKNALTAGCNDFLTKPVNLVWLQNKITEWGCMQALIDFDAWRIKGAPQKTIADKRLVGRDGQKKTTPDLTSVKPVTAK